MPLFDSQDQMNSCDSKNFPAGLLLCKMLIYEQRPLTWFSACMNEWMNDQWLVWAAYCWSSHWSAITNNKQQFPQLKSLNAAMNQRRSDQLKMNHLGLNLFQQRVSDYWFILGTYLRRIPKLAPNKVLVFNQQHHVHHTWSLPAAVCVVTKLESSQTGFLNITMFSDLQMFPPLAELNRAPPEHGEARYQCYGWCSGWR